jgi:replication factor A1
VRRGALDAARSVTPGAVSYILENPSPADAATVADLVVQVVDLKPIGSRFR